MRIGLLGSVTAQDALNAASQGQANAKVLTDYVDQPASNGFPGFAAIWDRAWGALPGILAPSANIASTVNLGAPAATQSTLPLVLAAAGVLGILMLTSKKRSRR